MNDEHFWHWQQENKDVFATGTHSADFLAYTSSLSNVGTILEIIRLYFSVIS